jgi:hypothetical protein
MQKCINLGWKSDSWCQNNHYKNECNECKCHYQKQDHRKTNVLGMKTKEELLRNGKKKRSLKKWW